MSKISDWVTLRGKLASNINSHIDEHSSAKDPTRLYALVDAAQVPELRGTKLRRLQAEYISLFDLSKESHISKYGPLLIPIRPERGASAPVVAALLQAMSHGWTVSWLSSKLDMGKLAEHLAGYLNGVMEDGSEVLVRYYDPRLLASFLSSPDENKKHSLLTPVNTWSYWDRELNFITIQGDNLEESDGVKDTLIPLHTQRKLADSSLGDLLTSGLTEQSDATEFSEWLPHALYSAVQRHLEQARDFGLSELADLQLFVTLSMTVHPDFHNLLEIFYRERENINAGLASFTDVVLSVPDAKWNALGEDGVEILEQLRSALHDQLLKNPKSLRNQYGQS